MVGQPWCGLTIWEICRHVGLGLDKRTVSTVAIRDMAKTGTGGFRHWRPWAVGVKLNPGDVLIYGTPRSGPVHTGLYVGNGRVVALPGPSWQESKKVEKVLTAAIPIDRRASLYARWGDWFAWTCSLGLVAGLILSVRRSGHPTLGTPVT